MTKTSADVSITQGNSAYSLAGATYNVYKGTSGTGSVVATFTTDEAGHATLSTPLEDGTYSVKEVTPPKGYKLDTKVYTFTIDGSDTSLSVEDEPGTLTLKLKKKDSQTGSTPQGNASLAGAVYQISYQKGGQTVTEELTSDASGNLGTLEGLPLGTVTVKELTAPEGYRLDTQVHTYTVDGSQLTGDVYELEVTDLAEEVQRGGLTIQKKDSQTGTTPQGDASLEGITFEIVNESQNPVVVNGSTAAPGQVAMTITTNASGVATTGENALPYGDYTLREVSTNESMLQTFTEEISVSIDSDNVMLEYEAENDVVRGGIDIEKQDSQMGTTPQGNSSFENIDFEIVNRSANPVVVNGTTYAVGDVVMTITTDENGHASTGNDALPYGTYEVRESVTNESMLLTWTGETVQVRQNGHSVAITAVNDVERGGLSVEKQDTITGSTPQGDANFEGITFEIINNSRNPVIVEGQKYQPGEVVKTLVTDSEGKASTVNDLLPYGEYILHESATNESMLITAPDQTVLVEDDGIIYEFVMANEVVRGGVLIEKRDLESGLLTPLGGASLDGTLFEITNKSINAVYVNGALYQPGEVCATIEVVDGIAQTDARALPYGTYQMVESKPGEGYLHTDQIVRSFQIRKDGEIIEFRDGDAAYNQVIRGDLQFVKVGEGGESNMGRFANVAFKLTSQTTGETHIVVTDENGEVRTETSWNPHTQNTNGNDEITDETLWDDHNGTWFGLTTEGWMVDVQDELCALPFDTYTLEELPCTGNAGYELVKVPNITISRNNTIIYLGTIDDQFEGVPEIGTTATVNGEHTAEPTKEVTIVDTVTYKNLKMGQTYKLSGVLMDKATGEPLLVGEQQVTAELEFTPDSPDGTVELTYRCVWAIKEYPPSTEEQAILSRMADRSNVTVRIYNRLVDAVEQHKIIQNAHRRNLLKAGGNDVQETVEAESNLKDMIQLLESPDMKGSPLLHTAVFLELKATDPERLRELQSDVEMELTRAKINVDKLTLRQLDGFLSVTPFGNNRFGSLYERVLPASSVANLYPFNYSGKTDPHGFYLGRDKFGTNILTDFDRRSEDKTNANILILGNSGQGKSYGKHENFGLSGTGIPVPACQSLPGTQPHDPEAVCHRLDRGRAGTGRGPVSGRTPRRTGG